ncbi:heme/hemin ABC transporter substrate-binding protein [Shewanella nanhaiensis]|uniref:ABC transporter substrate-binding protein n=1 Tax=Shewanella nanhaiensis TaxID=2864872 RepID=A0ABS7DYW8_9GAMM|nr:ABC transporter substrate-binding protein [Shewanella nanhaiensis]MBW8182485.1 ABC transporter substrate-binding protein [Shewanella nanhaiensis]
MLNKTKLNGFIPPKIVATTLLWAGLSAGISAHDAEHHNEVTRLVSAGAGMTELVIALDAGDELVAVDSTSQLPETLSSVEKLGYHRMLSAEGILALEPDLVLGSDAMGPETTLEVLEGADIKVVKLAGAETAEQLLSNINKLGELLDRQKQAETLKFRVAQSFDSIKQKRVSITGSDKVPSILFMLLQDDRPVRVGGEGTAADTIIKLAGGKNIADFVGYKSLSQEGVLALQPDLILISSRSESEEQSAPDKVLKQMPLLIHTPAGEHKMIHTLKAQALLGGLGLSSLEAADKLASSLIEIQKY